MGSYEPHRNRNWSSTNGTFRDVLAWFSTPGIRKPEVTEDGSPGIDDPDGAIQEYGTREHRRKQDSFLENRTEKHNTHT